MSHLLGHFTHLNTYAESFVFSPSLKKILFACDHECLHVCKVRSLAPRTKIRIPISISVHLENHTTRGEYTYQFYLFSNLYRKQVFFSPCSNLFVLLLMEGLEQFKIFREFVQFYFLPYIQFRIIFLSSLQQL